MRLEQRDLFLLSSGRDKICIVWDLRSYETSRTVPVFEVWVPVGQGEWGRDGRRGCYRP